VQFSLPLADVPTLTTALREATADQAIVEVA
jgi:hypothetical protein